MNFTLYCCTLVPLMLVGCIWCVRTLVSTIRDIIADLREEDPSKSPRRSASRRVTLHA